MVPYRTGTFLFISIFFALSNTLRFGPPHSEEGVVAEEEVELELELMEGGKAEQMEGEGMVANQESPEASFGCSQCDVLFDNIKAVTRHIENAHPVRIDFGK